MRDHKSLMRKVLRAWPLLLASAASCGGPHQAEPPIEAGDAGPPPAVCTEDVRPGPAPIRRLTRVEYNNTVRDLFGDVTAPADAFVREEEQDGFNNNAN